MRRNFYVTKYLAKNWFEAKQYCEDYGMIMATFRSRKEAELFNSKAGVDIWVGISDLYNENSFVQIDGVKIPDLPWFSGMPDDFASNENCVQSGYVGGFDDMTCKREMKFACATNELLPSPAPEEITSMVPTTRAPITTKAPPFDTVFTNIGSFGENNQV
jgi:Lectin C-type domain